MYQNVLQKLYQQPETYNPKANIVNHIHYFLNQNLKSDQKIGVSLSGGVDSMVISSIIRNLGYSLVVLHIDYGNREESGEEAEFIKYYCQQHRIDLVYHEMDIFRATSNRRYYESTTKKTRFGLYKKLIEAENVAGICLGHHDGDIVENVFNNFIGGQSILDLPKIKSVNILEGVPIWRPLIGIQKLEIFEYAHQNNILYFKNTTPSSSCRGFMREQIFPMLESYNKGFIRNLKQVGEQSTEWGEFIEGAIIQPFIRDNVIISSDLKCIHVGISLENLETMPIIFWHSMLNQCFHQCGIDGVSRKSVFNLIIKLRQSFEIKCKIIIKKHIASIWDGKKLLISC